MRCHDAYAPKKYISVALLDYPSLELVGRAQKRDVIRCINTVFPVEMSGMLLK